MTKEQSVYVIGEQGLIDELVKAGIRVLNIEDDSKDSTTLSDSELVNYEVDPSVVAVVVGFKAVFTYRNLCISSLYIQLNNAEYIATNPDRHFLLEDSGRYIPGGGAINKAVEHAT